LSKNYLAYTFLILAALFWSGNFIIGKFATLFEVPPLTLNFLRWVVVWLILIPFTIKEILSKKNYIRKNFLVIGFMGVLSISTFNSVVYFALNFTQVINAVLMLSAIPVVIIIFSSIMKIEKTNIFQLSGLILSVTGVGTIISNADIQKIVSLNFNKGDLWMIVCVISWSLYSTLLKKNKSELSQFALIQIMVSIGLIFLVPQFLYEQSTGLDFKINKPFIFILLYVVIFPAIAAYYCWQKAIELIGPNRSAMFIQLMPLFSALMAIIIFKEKFQLYHFIGAAFIVSGIYLSNRKTQ
jgi:drug/metabolite transporter (DMT)-like permease